MMKPRWLACCLAWIANYFWLPCPICGENFAGFEWGESLMRTLGSGEGTCSKPECIAETRKRNKEFQRNNPFITSYPLPHSVNEDER
jgi:hypothetical protein